MRLEFPVVQIVFLVSSVLEASEIATVDGFLAEEDQRSRHGHKRSSGSRDPHPDK